MNILFTRLLMISQIGSELEVAELQAIIESKDEQIQRLTWIIIGLGLLLVLAISIAVYLYIKEEKRVKASKVFLRNIRINP